MPIELPRYYRLDSEGELFQELQQATHHTFVTIGSRIEQNLFMPSLQATAELTIPDARQVLEAYRRDVFVTAGGLAYVAFEKSDAPQRLRAETLRFLARLSIPEHILPGDPLGNITACEQYANFGYEDHPEFQEHIDFAKQYYTELTQNDSVGEAVYLGAGFSVYQIERAWRQARDHLINKTVKEEIEKTNWEDRPE